jgi:outer membrane protein assembly factor BamB
MPFGGQPVKHILAASTLLLALPVHAGFAAPDTDWCQWRGSKRDGISPDTGLLKSWPSDGPPLLWKATGLGTGFSSLSVCGDRIYTMGEANGAFNLLSLSAADGKIQWTVKVADVPAKRAGGEGDFPGPRATPATDGKLVITLGPYGDLVCVQADSGKELWRKSFRKDFGGKMMSDWMYSESPLLDGDNLICTPGSPKGTVIALKKSTGELLWQSADLTDPAAYASLVPAEIGGKRQYLILTAAHVAGIEASSGVVLWKADRPGKVAVIPDPVYKDGTLFVTSAYGVGCTGFSVSVSAEGIKAEEIYADKKLQNHHGGALLVGDHVYFLDEAKMKCVELKTGKLAWEDKSVGKGSIAYADGHFVVRSEKKPGTVALVEASPAGYKETGRFNPPDASKDKIWSHPVIIGGRLYLRDQDVLLCYDLRAK